MGDEISKTTEPAGGDCGDGRVDAACKAVLSLRPILARLLSGTLAEYAGRSAAEVESCIEAGGDRLTRGSYPGDQPGGDGEGEFDLLLRAKVPGGARSLRLIVNVATRKDFYPGEAALTRGSGDYGRLIRSRGGRGIEISDPNCEACAVWICVNPPAYLRGTVDVFSINGRRVGDRPGLDADGKDYDQLTVVVVCLGGDPGDAKRAGVPGLLEQLFDPARYAAERRRIRRGNFNVPADETDRQLDAICRLAQESYELGVAEGRAEALEARRTEGVVKGRTQFLTETILRMLTYRSLSATRIAACTGIAADTVVKLRAMIDAQVGKRTRLRARRAALSRRPRPHPGRIRGKGGADHEEAGRERAR